MEFFEVIQKRRSVRKYTLTPVPEEVVRKALQAAVIAPTSSNLQQWEFYWVRSSLKKAQLVEACMSQSAAKTSQELIVAVSRIDTWKKHAELVYENAKKNGPVNPLVTQYYTQLIPMMYSMDPLGLLGIVRKILFTGLGFFKPVPRGPIFTADLYEVATKTTALACENFMLAIVAQGYATCPMEGFDACRVRKVLNLRGKAHIVMVMSVGEADPAGIYGAQFRVDPSLVIHEI